ncbi:NADH kinase pos5 [Tulasnella sp. JGI-2019a]|nr:NADH kinase pos5 [Tulasnella sp. JGI-2019a]
MQALLASTFRAVGNRVNGRATENLTRSLSCSTFQPLPTPSSHPNVLIVRKRDDEKVERAFHVILRHLRERYPNATLLQSSTEGPLHPRCERLTDGSPINLVITLGGDGTILRASSLFREGPVPPVLSFSLGTLGFLLPFQGDRARVQWACNSSATNAIGMQIDRLKR